jgi:hypothetical protein
LALRGIRSSERSFCLSGAKGKNSESRLEGKYRQGFYRKGTLISSPFSIAV